ncbi:MAG: hypothetical protein ABIJ48_09745 [Actinomycetota bacterium]
MRRPALLATAVVVLAAVAAGCGDDGGGTSSSSTTTLLPLQCPNPVTVTSAEDLVAVLTATAWAGLGSYTSGPLPITPDLVVVGTIVLDASALPVPEDCRGRADCSPQAGLRVDLPVDGVVAEGDANLECGDAYSRVIFTDTTVRLRPYLRDTHPCRFNFVPLVEVAPPCGSPCGEGQRLCPVDGVCYAAGTGFCQACEGGAKEACACRGPEGPLEDGSDCSYWQSGDVLCDGTCRQGVCAAEPCP